MGAVLEENADRCSPEAVTDGCQIAAFLRNGCASNSWKFGMRTDQMFFGGVSQILGRLYKATKEQSF